MTQIPERSGLQPERTSLAWNRTAAAALAALLPPILVDLRLTAYGPLYGGLAASLVAVALVLGVRRRMRQLRSDDVRVVRASPWAVLWRVGVVTLLAACGGLVTAAYLLVG